MPVLNCLNKQSGFPARALWLFFFIFICSLATQSAWAQNSGSAMPLNLVDNFEDSSFRPRLNVFGENQPMRLESLTIRTEIKGGLAESTLDMIFRNQSLSQRVMEGELEFPLAPGQEISGLALDIDGELRQGVPVAKARGQEVFEDIARRKVDPALLEATQGNVYRLRVYPILAGGQRRVVIRVMEPLQAQNGRLTYRLPLSFAQQLDSITVEAEIVSPAGPVEVQSGNLGLSLAPSGSFFRGRAEHKNFTPEGWLDISLPAPSSLSETVATAPWGDKTYFVAAAQIPLPQVARKLPDQVTLLWDASGSGEGRNLAKEFALLDTYFKALGTGQARLVVLRDVAEEPQVFQIKDGDWSALKQTLQALKYDGATNLASWSPQPDVQEYLLFSDGLANWGLDKKPGQLTAKQRLFAITSAPTADLAALRGLAAQGAVIDLAHQGPEQAESLLLTEGARLSVGQEALADGGQVVLAPDSAYVVASGQGQALVRLAGWIKNSGGEAKIPVTLTLADGQVKTQTLTIKPSLENSDKNADQPPLAARLWGRYELAELEKNYQVNKKAMARLGQELGLVSRETSLIVLETAQDYARYEVTPPANLAQAVERLRLQKANQGGEKLLPEQQLVAMWQDKVKWWETDFKQPKKGKNQKSIVVESQTSNEIGDNESNLNSPSDFAQAPPVPATMGITSNSATYEWDDGGAALGVSRRERASEEGLMAQQVMVQPASPAVAAKMAAPESPSRPDIGLTLKPWASNAPYVARFKEAKDDELYAIYLDEKPDYLKTPGFFFDAADVFFERGKGDLGLRVLSNLAEMELENRQVLRMLAYRLVQAGQFELAIPVLEKVKELAPYEPQSWRDLALALAEAGQTQRAIDLLYETARRQWSDRFGSLNTIALTEMNNLIARHEGKVKTEAIDSRLIKNLASDLRVVLSWDTDNTDMDLWITAPDGEETYYQSPLSRQGGQLSRDCTQGYGPEEFMLKKAAPGLYQVKVDYFGNSQQQVAGEVTMMVTVFSHYGMPDEKKETTTLRLKTIKDKILAAEFRVEQPK